MTSLEDALKNFDKGTVIINATAYTAVDKAEEEFEQALKVNRDGIVNLRNICREKGFKLIHVSTDYVFNGEKNTPYTEDDDCTPLGKYGESKRAGELALIESDFNDFVIIRTSWLYSEFNKNFLKTMVALSDREELSVVYDQVGSPTYAEDLATWIKKFSDDTLKINGEVYHFSNEGVCSWYDFATAIMANLEAKCVVKPILSAEYPTPTKRPAYSVFNKKKIKDHFSASIPHWDGALKRCMENFK